MQISYLALFVGILLVVGCTSESSTKAPTIVSERQAYELVLRLNPNLPRCADSLVAVINPFMEGNVLPSPVGQAHRCHTGIGVEVSAPYGGMSWQVYRLDGNDRYDETFVVSLGGLTASELRQTKYPPNSGNWFEGSLLNRVWNVDTATGDVKLVRSDF